MAKHLGLFTLGTSLPLIVFDEIHKYRYWKRFLKGFFDTYEKKARIIVTGSSRLDVYKRGGDSMMGRYFLYRIHPFSLRELADPSFKEWDISLPISCPDFDILMKYGGFPEPFIQRNERFTHQWRRLRLELLFKEDLRDLTKIQDLGQMEVLAQILTSQVGGLVDYTHLASMVKTSSPTIQRWMNVLSSFYYCFTLQPWSKNISKTLIKQPKVYLWDWSMVVDIGARHENFVASHLLKAVHLWTDAGLGDYGLYYLRDKLKREVDFLVVKNGKPWFLVEVKTSEKGISPSLHYFQTVTKAPHAFQVSFDLPFVQKDCFTHREPIQVPVQTLLAQLV